MRGSEPSKSDSPYTSFSDQLGTSKDYGSDLLTLDRGGLRQDIADGKVDGVEILDHEDVLDAHDGYIRDAQARYDANPTPKNQERLDRAQQDWSNSVCDREVLIKGRVPSKYITRPPEGGTPPEGLGSKDAAPPADSAEAGPQDVPLLQVGARDGGVPGEAAAEQAGRDTAEAGNSDPTVQQGDNLVQLHDRIDRFM